MLADKMDVTNFMVWFIENYSHSVEECRRKQVRAMEEVNDENMLRR